MICRCVIELPIGSVAADVSFDSAAEFSDIGLKETRRSQSVGDATAHREREPNDTGGIAAESREG